MLPVRMEILRLDEYCLFCCCMLFMMRFDVFLTNEWQSQLPVSGKRSRSWLMSSRSFFPVSVRTSNHCRVLPGRSSAPI